MKIPKAYIKDLARHCKEKIWEPFPGVIVVAWQLPNGYVISKQAACVDPDNYDREVGIRIARKALRNKLWELEGYIAKDAFSGGCCKYVGGSQDINVNVSIQSEVEVE